MKNQIEFTQVNNDVNGNPRFVVHFLAFISNNDEGDIMEKLRIALNRAHLIGGNKYRGKEYGGGIVFTEIPQYLEPKIIELMKKYK